MFYSWSILSILAFLALSHGEGGTPLLHEIVLKTLKYFNAPRIKHMISLFSKLYINFVQVNKYDPLEG